MTNIFTKQIKLPFIVKIIFVIFAVIDVLLYLDSFSGLRYSTLMGKYNSNASGLLALSSFFLLPSIIIITNFITLKLPRKVGPLIKALGWVIGGLGFAVGIATAAYSTFLPIFFIN